MNLPFLRVAYVGINKNRSRLDLGIIFICSRHVLTYRHYCKFMQQLGYGLTPKRTK